MQIQTPLPPWLPEFFVGGHPALDLANTVSDRLTPALSVDRFAAAPDILSWMASTGLVPRSHIAKADLRGKAGDAFARDARTLREDAWAVITDYAAGRQPRAAPLGHIMSAIVPGMAALRVDDGAADGFPAYVPEKPVPAAFLSLLGLQVLDALYRLPPTRIRACPRCGWLFHDTSKGGRRKWCSMQDCGNREKAARHYRAHRNDGETP